MSNQEWIFFGIINALLIFKLGWDWYAKNKQKRVIDHFRSALIDGIIYAMSIYFLKISWFYLLFAVSYRWIVFDIAFNKLNGWSWDNYGSTSKIDLFMKKTGKWHIAIKLIILTLSTVLIWKY